MVYTCTIFIHCIWHCFYYCRLKTESRYRPDIVGGHILAGYSKEQTLNSTEMEVIRVCMCGRLIQTLVLGAYSFYKNPKNTYVLQTSK